jgi:hypothetical protein
MKETKWYNLEDLRDYVSKKMDIAITEKHRDIYIDFPYTSCENLEMITKELEEGGWKVTHKISYLRLS